MKKKSDFVTLVFNELKEGSKSFAKEIADAYGPNGLGIVVIKNVPKFTEYRKQLLPLSQKLATLPGEKLQKLTDPKSNYSIGWSHGVEKFEGKLDLSKGSFYANPQFDRPELEDNAHKTEIIAENIWPKEDLPELEPAFKQLGQLIVDTGALLASHLDKYLAENLADYENDKLHRIITTSRACKGRLLHYFASKIKHIIRK